jgi:DNA topoisomerase-6 subunit B
LLYDEGSDVAREVISEVEINKMGISKKEVKEQFANQDSKSDRAVELLPIHIFFHICSTKIPYKTAGKESIAAEGDLKKYMKSCLTDLYRKVSAQIRKELRMKDAESRLRLYRHYIPLIVNAISESINVDPNKLSEAFSRIAENHIKGEFTEPYITKKEDKITDERIEKEVEEITEVEGEVTKHKRISPTVGAERRMIKKFTKRYSKKKSRKAEVKDPVKEDQIASNVLNKLKGSRR